MIGLVHVGISSEARQALRPHFRMLLNKPLHHRTIVELLAKLDDRESAQPARARNEG